MQRACIAIVDAAHARIYTFDTQDSGGDQPRLRERRDLVSPGRAAHGMFTDQPSAHFRGARDDHRTDHLAELDDRFAKIIVDEIERVIDEVDLEHVILVASPKMLGTLRRQQSSMWRAPNVVDEIPQNLAWMTTAQLHDHLAAMSLLQPRERVMPERAARTLR
jgi:protein required for attachment to host cells